MIAPSRNLKLTLPLLCLCFDGALAFGNDCQSLFSRSDSNTRVAAAIEYNVRSVEWNPAPEQVSQVKNALQAVDRLLEGLNSATRVDVELRQQDNRAVEDLAVSDTDGSLRLLYQAAPFTADSGRVLATVMQHERAHQYFAENIMIGNVTLAAFKAKALKDFRLARNVEDAAFKKDSENDFKFATHRLLKSLDELWADLVPTLLSKNPSAISDEIIAGIYPKDLDTIQQTMHRQRDFKPWAYRTRLYNAPDIYTPTAGFRSHFATHYLGNSGFSAKQITSQYLKVAQSEVDALVSAFGSRNAGHEPSMEYEAFNTRLIQKFDGLMGQSFPISVDLQSSYELPVVSP